MIRRALTQSVVALVIAALASLVVAAAGGPALAAGAGVPAVNRSGVPAVTWSGVPVVNRSGVPAVNRSGVPAVNRSGVPPRVACPLFVPADVRVNDRFGTAIGIDGDDLAVGSWLADEQGLRDAGSVTVFTIGPDGAASEVQRLVAEPPEPRANFGFSVDLDGDVLAVGAVAASTERGGDTVTEAGAVHVFERAGADQPWVWSARLVAADAESDDRFGYSLEVDAASGTIIVGAHTDDVELPDADTAGDAAPLVDAGSAYLFERTETGSWTQTKKLVDPTARPGDRAGHDVAISGRWMIVGHHLDDQVGNRTVNNAGGALLYERTDDGIVGPLELTGSAPMARDRAGIAVDVDDDLLAMTGWSQNPGDRSVLWVFRHGDAGWREEVRIELAEPIVGEADRDSNGDSNGVEGSVDSDSNGGRTPTARTAPATQFGRHLAVANGIVIVGASADGVGAPGGGAVHIFGAPAGEWGRLGRIAPDDVGENAQAGISVGLSERWAAMGAERAELGLRNSGGACVLPLAGLLDDAAIEVDPSVTVVLDAGDRAPAPAEPLGAGPLQRLGGDRSNNTVAVGVIAAGVAAAVMALAAVVLVIRSRGRGDPRLP
ncbi:MAG: FG-GAP repeat protein [Actinomycetota bacterium]